MLPKAHFATVYAKPAGRPMVDTFITEVSQDTWILFPWDTEPQYAQRGGASRSPRCGWATSGGDLGTMPQRRPLDREFAS